MSGPTITFSIVCTAGGASVMKRPLKKSSPSRPMKPASRKPIVISFQSICQSPRKLWATSDQAAAEVSRSRQPMLARRPRGAGGRPAPAGRARAPAPRAAARRRRRSSDRHQRDHHDPADELGERELPADQDPEHQAELPDEVGRGELEGERGRGRGALLEERLGDRDRRVGAGGGGGAEAGRPGERPEAAARRAPLDPLARHPGLDDRRDREAEHQRPPDLVGHQEGLLEALPDR